MRATLAALSLFAANTACLRSTEFRCEGDTECGSGNRCEIQNGIGHCVIGNAVPDGGPQDGSPGDDATDGPPTTCPGTMIGAHFYQKTLQMSTWQAAQNFCAATAGAPARAYLAIPDNAQELTDIAGVAAASVPFWVGISDETTEGKFITTKGDMATFLPWTAGAPTTTPPNNKDDCVEAISATNIKDVQCNGSLFGMCECEP
jgi:lectin-like protein